MASRFSVQAVFEAIDRLTGPMRRMAGSVARATQRMEARFRHVDRVGQAVTRTFARAGVAVGAAAVAVGAGAANVARAGAEFEQAITNVGAVSLRSRDQIADLEARALELGASTKFTATEVAQGMELMAKSGFESADIMSGIEGVLAAAAAAGGDLAETAGTVSNVLKGMGLETAEASRVADVLALASARTNSTISSLGESMKNVSPVARQFGIEFEDAVSAVALLQDVGLDASEAGTATATMLTKLAKPTSALEAKMRRMGVSFKDARGDMLPLSEVLGQLDKASKRAGGNMEVVAFMADLVGLRGQKAALNLQDMFAKGKVGELAAQLRQAEGAAAKMAGVKMDTATGDMLKLEAAVDAVKIALFNTESGPLRGIIQALTEWVSKNQELIVSGFQDFMAWIRDNGEKIVDVLSRFGRATAIVLGVAGAFKVAAVASGLLTAALTLNPFTAWAVALTALAALLAAFWPEIDSFLKGIGIDVEQVGSAIWSALVETWQAVTGAVRGYVEFVVGVWAVIIGAMRSALEPYWDFVRNGFSALADLLRPIWEPQIAALRELGRIALEVFRSVADWAGQYLGPVWDTIGGIVSSVRGVGRSVLGGDGDSDGEPRTPPAATSGPQESIARSISERVERTEGEITVRAESGTSASVTKRPRGRLRLQASGAF